MSHRYAALAAGIATLGLVGTATLSAWREGSAVVPREGGLADQGSAWGFLTLLVAAFLAYLAGLWLLRRGAVSLAPVAVLAVAVQLVPLGAPLLLSTDAWTYWAYGWIATEGDGNPYRDEPMTLPTSPALPFMGAAWLGTTSVYAPGFTLASEPLARIAGNSEDTAAWVFKGLAGAGAVAAALLAARVARRRALAAAFVGWNPLLAVHLAGGGHNDAWMGALLAAALALAAARRLQGAGAMWALAVLVKWVPLLFLALRTLEARGAGRPVRHLGFAITGGAVLVLATARYGLSWLGAVLPLAGNAARETSFALPARAEQLGVPRGVALSLAAVGLLAGTALLARSALAGRARLGLAACLLLVTTPYLAVWYLGWAVPLAAIDEDDRAARLGCLGLCAYLLPQTIPL